MLHFLQHDVFFLKFNTGGHGHNALAAVETGADVIAKAHLFPHLHKQLAGHAGTEDGVAHLHGGISGIPQGDGSHIAHTQFALGHIQYFFPLAVVAGLQTGLGGQGHGLLRQAAEHGPKGIGHSLRIHGTYEEHMDGAFLQHLPVVGVQAFGGDGLHIGDLAQTGNAVGILLAQLL